MDAQGPNEATMAYNHIPLSDRRESNMDNCGSTPFQSHQSLGQALGSHLAAAVGTRPYPDSYPLSPSPPIPNAQGHQDHSNAPLAFSVPQPGDSPSMKRKQVDSMSSSHLTKKRRDGDDGEGFESDIGAQGAKHWTDEEKSKLFNWLMGDGQDDHWNALRATKNSCLRECANEIFGSKKTYQALKGCYERNFNLFSQIYAFESYHAHSGSGPVEALCEADRLREYERRLQSARKAGCNVGNVTARTIDHWHRIGWYGLFYRRWHGDPATARRATSRHVAAGTSVSTVGEELDGDDDQVLEFPEPNPPDLSGIANGMNGHPPNRSHPNPFVNPQNLKEHSNPFPSSSTTSAPMDQARAFDSTPINITIPQGMMSTYLQFLQTQTHTNKMKLEYMRRREEREEKESMQRSELERLRLERENAELEHNKRSAEVKQNADRAIAILANPIIEASLKQSANNYLKKLFKTD